MRFGPVPLSVAEGQILAHNVSDGAGRRVLRKGRVLDAAGVALLRSLGHESVFVASLEQGDIPEDEAAEQISKVVAGFGVTADAAHVGRVNLSAEVLGVLEVDVSALRELNRIEGVTVATSLTHTLVRPGERVVTVKIIPYGISADEVGRAEASRVSGGVVRVRPIPSKQVAVVLAGQKGAWPTLVEGIGAAIRRRIEAFGCTVSEVATVEPDEEALANILGLEVASEVAMLVLAGETAIMDLDDLIPRGLRRAGGRVEQLGLAMDPGQLLLLGYLGDTPVIGAPGCVRGSVPDGFDAVVGRLLTGEHLCAADIADLGHGGLLANPRSS